MKVDRTSMATGLEVRSPLLDHRVVEWSWRLPRQMKSRGGQGKWILREVLARHVPRPLFARPKQGFGAPVGHWLARPLRGWAEDLLAYDRLGRQGILKPEAVPRESIDAKHRVCDIRRKVTCPRLDGQSTRE